MIRQLSLALLALSLATTQVLAQTGTTAPSAGTFHVYIGTYTSGESKGIYLFEMNAGTGALEPKGLAGEAVNPSFLAVHPARTHLYAVGEMSDFAGKKSGAVSAFSMDRESGKLTLLNQQPSGGTGPCHVTIDRAGKHVFVANYGSGSAGVLPVDEGGRLKAPSSVVQHEGSGPNERRQQGPHAHSINLDPAGRYAVVADLGVDKVFVYRFDPSQSKLQPNTPPSASVAPGAGPRHFAFHPGGRYAYVINELASTVTAFDWDAEKGALKELHTVSTLPEGATEPSTTAEVQVHPSGKFLYGSNRGHDSIAMFAIEAESGRLRAIGHQRTQGKTPRNFGIDPSGRWLIAANQASDTLVVFRIDSEKGSLEPTGVTAKVPAPVCVKFVPRNGR